MLRLGAAEASSLRAWLNREPGLRGRVTLRQEPSAQDRMGSLLHTVVVALGSGSAALLARSLPLWIKQRRSDVTIELSIGDRTARIEASHLEPERARRLVEEALTQLPPSENQNSTPSPRD
ncbi:hypothetical protein [Streptomyces sp. NPDC006668]|uniref:effector-associated constant component EACC1 n=1 Tax=Streptomyces sp. NPDC006668 TaxID=3156903 RepID=UPI0033D57855